MVLMLIASPSFSSTGCNLGRSTVGTATVGCVGEVGGVRLKVRFIPHGCAIRTMECWLAHVSQEDETDETGLYPQVDNIAAEINVIPRHYLTHSCLESF
jgi:hypothetical protein